MADEENKQMSLRDISKSVVVANAPPYFTHDRVNCGSFQRIADSLEKIANGNPWARIEELEHQRDYWQRRCYRSESENNTLKRSNAAYKGHINRMKERLSAIEADGFADF